MVRVVAWKRVVLGGSMHGQKVQVLHGSTMRSAVSGDEYRRYTDAFWVSAMDTDEEAAKRVAEWVNSK